MYKKVLRIIRDFPVPTTLICLINSHPYRSEALILRVDNLPLWHNTSYQSNHKLAENNGKKKQKETNKKKNRKGQFRFLLKAAKKERWWFAT
jgi:hypothetical protein